ncbi:MAG: TetR/AcrR family transcriptional regulator [Maribacter sp.]
MVSTERKIKDAALQVFAEKGYDQTKTRDIANSAGVNISTLHYYYRSKDKLFKMVSDEVFAKFNQISDSIFESDIPFKEKINRFVSDYTDFCRKNPKLASFIVFESERNPEKVYDNIDFERFDRKIELELKHLIAEGIVRPISYPNFILNLVSLTVFPFLNKHMLHKMNGLTENDFNDLLEQRKTMVPKMVIDYLYLK